MPPERAALPGGTRNGSRVQKNHKGARCREQACVCEPVRFCDLEVAWDEWSWPSPLFHPLWNDLFAVLGVTRSSRNPHHWNLIAFLRLGDRHER